MTVPLLHVRAQRTLARTAWQRLLLDRTTEFWIGELQPSWSLTELRARVVDIVDETSDAKTFVLATPRAWPGHRAGQYVPVEVEIDGARARRCYSISSGHSAAGAQRIAITVKRVTDGRVSSWMHDRLAIGDLVRLGTPAGDFTVDDPERPLLLVGGGSGITPIMAIVRGLVARGTVRDVVVVHAARSEAEAIFGAQLTALGATVPGLRVVAHRGPLDAAALEHHAPDHAARETFACGPAGLVDIVRGVVGDRVHVEHFVAPPVVRREGTRATVRLALVGRTHELGGGTLLQELERAGERPAHGCRMGICNSCRCTKTAGTVEDLLTNTISSEPDQEIRLCTSIARSDLELAL